MKCVLRDDLLASSPTLLKTTHYIKYQQRTHNDMPPTNMLLKCVQIMQCLPELHKTCTFLDNLTKDMSLFIIDMFHIKINSTTTSITSIPIKDGGIHAFPYSVRVASSCSGPISMLWQEHNITHTQYFSIHHIVVK